MKKICSIILSLILILGFTVTTTAKQVNVISLGRIAVTMPEISIEIVGGGFNKDDISATLASEKLSVVDVAKYDVDTDSSCAYILVDLSTSMYETFDLVKSNIITYIESLSSNDKIVLITFGETEVNTVLTGTESKNKAIKIVKELECDENGTLFYEALSKAYQISNSTNDSFDREYVIAFSDGIDVQRGSATFDEVYKLYDSHTLPLYAVCSYNTLKDAADKFGEMARVSGGAFSIVESEEDFNKFLSEINDVTIVDLKAATNYADGKEKQLSVKVGSSQVEYNIPIVRSISDASAPKVTQLIYNVEKDVFVISFSEKVLGANLSNSYKITDSHNKKIEISDIFYSESEDIYEIKTKDAICKGTYTFEFSGIKDDSQESNALVGKKTVYVEKTNNTTGLPLWAIILIVVGSILVIGIFVIFAILLNKKNKIDKGEENIVVPIKNHIDNIDYIEPAPNVIKHHIKTNEAIRIRLRIKTGKTSEQNIETNIVSSLIVGRSDTCDIYIDDTKLSRQHFVIENDNGTFYLTDLQSRNGTMLNGIRINSRQHLNSGDKIMAGLSDISITILGR